MGDEKVVPAGLADMLLVCQDGVSISASRWVMVQKSGLITRVLEDFNVVGGSAAEGGDALGTLERTADGKVKIPVPGIPSESLKIAVQLLHDLIKVYDLAAQEPAKIMAAIQGLDVLDAEQHMQKSLDQMLWSAITSSSSKVENISSILGQYGGDWISTDPGKAALIISRIWTEKPTISNFLDAVKPLIVDGKVADIVLCAVTQTALIPPTIMLHWLFVNIPERDRNEATLVRFFNLIAPICLPNELSRVLDLVSDIAQERGWRSGDAMRTIYSVQASFQHEDLVSLPRIAEFRKPSSSRPGVFTAHVSFSGNMFNKGERVFKLSHWGQIRVHPTSNIMTFSIKKSGDKSMQLGKSKGFIRLVAVDYEKNVFHEMRYYRPLAPADENAPVESENLELQLGTAKAFCEILKSKFKDGPKGIRMDFFFNNEGKCFNEAEAVSASFQAPLQDAYRQVVHIVPSKRRRIA